MLGLLRIKQWYKNILVFLGIIFSLNLFNISLLGTVGLGFIALCLASSAGYIINDIIDRKKDCLNPDKKHRLIASGKVPVSLALMLSASLYIISLTLSFFLSVGFFYTVLALCCLTIIYTFWLKHILFADIATISTNFVLRAFAGVILIDEKITPWFLLFIFSLSFFLVLGKRYGDLVSLSKEEMKYKPVLLLYSASTVVYSIVVFLTCLIIVFGLYVASINTIELFFFYPLFIFVLLRYFSHIIDKNDAIKNPEDFLFKKVDLFLVCSALLLCVGVLAVLYV
jgi:4-hydroxybenzoate polyprenyltransferase